jgi:hypothetical protein
MSPAHAQAEQHCVVTVVGQQADGMLRTTTPRCYPTFPEAMSSIGLAASGRFPSQPAGIESFALAIHYDGFDGTGSSLTVNGLACNGGWLNLSSTWINRISSTWNGCGHVDHYDGNNLTGSIEETAGVGVRTNLTTLNNATNSVQYLA